MRPIYRKRYWDEVRGDRLPCGVDYALFDYAVHSGPARAGKALQRVLGVRQDGRIGPVTLAALGRHAPDEIVAKVCRARLGFLRGLPTWAPFGRGWRRRVDEVARAALAMSKEEPAGNALAGPAAASAPAAASSGGPAMLAADPGATPPTGAGDAVMIPATPGSGDAGQASAPKPWWRSSGLWGVIVSAMFKALAIALPGQIDPGLEPEALHLVLLAVSFLGDIVAAYGRWNARRPIGAAP